MYSNKNYQASFAYNKRLISLCDLIIYRLQRKMMFLSFLVSIFGISLVSAKNVGKPNVVILMADDLVSNLK